MNWRSAAGLIGGCLGILSAGIIIRFGLAGLDSSNPYLPSKSAEVLLFSGLVAGTFCLLSLLISVGATFGLRYPRALMVIAAIVEVIALALWVSNNIDIGIIFAGPLNLLAAVLFILAAS